RNLRSDRGLPQRSIVTRQIGLHCRRRGSEEPMLAVMRPLTAVTAAIVAASFAGWAMPASAAKRHQPVQQLAPVERTATGTIIQPTTTIIPDGTGHARVIVIPRRRSYLDTGTEVSVGDRYFRDYVLPPAREP